MVDRKKTLSKSKFIAGLQCRKRLYLQLHHRDLATPPSPAKERIFSLGNQVGEAARKQFEDGFLIEADYLKSDKAIKDTKKAIESGYKILIEPAFYYDDILVRLDVFVFTQRKTWVIFEVKASTSVSDTYIADIAIQRYVTEQCGYPVENCFIMHLNKECTYPDLSNLFTVENVTDKLNERWPELYPFTSAFQDLLTEGEMPIVPIGTHCKKPYTCEFKEYCWKDVIEPSIFSIPHVSKKALLEFSIADIDSIADIPSDFPLSENQRRYVNLIQSGKPKIMISDIKNELDKLIFPLYFLDFETQMDAIPKFPALHPYEAYPFQYSLHILDEEGNLSHTDYLHNERTDPRPFIAEALTQVIGDKGSIIAYNASYEKRIISALAEHIPSFRETLDSYLDRFYDLLLIFREYYFHPDFAGSNSIKSVLPVLVPELSYKDLEIQGGDIAQVMWEIMITTDDDSNRLSIYENLRDYCRVDTLGMVKLFEHLRETMKDD